MNKIKTIFFLTLSSLILTSCATENVAPQTAMPDKPYVAEKKADKKYDELSKEMAAGRLIVVFKKPAMANSTVKTIDSIPSISFEKMIYDQSDLKIASFSVPAGQEKKYMSTISSIENVHSVEVDQIISINGH